VGNGGRAMHAGLQRDWDFVPGKWKPFRISQRYYELRYAEARPPMQPIKEVSRRPLWATYFVYSPDGTLKSHHRFTLSRLRDENFSVFIICAAPSPGQVPDELHRYGDAIYWKGLSGYDFSAYTLALESLCAHSPGADLLLMNDSVYGTFRPLRQDVETARWRVTGYTATFVDDNHIQSYAVIFKNLDDALLGALRPVMPCDRAFSSCQAVVKHQEVGMARVAARSVRVGAYWYADGSGVADPCLQAPFDLLSGGFPFLKRSLLGRMQVFQNVERTRQTLAGYGHPLPEAG